MNFNMKIINQTEKIYIYDEFVISHHSENTTIFRRCKNARVPYWEYFHTYDDAWKTITKFQPNEEELENLYQEWLTIKN